MVVTAPPFNAIEPEVSLASTVKLVNFVLPPTTPPKVVAPADSTFSVCAPSTVDAAAPASEAGTACPDIPTMLAKSCGTSGCHDSTTQAEALDLVSPDVAARLVGVPASEGAGLLIDPGTPSDSVLYTKLLPNPPFGARMP